MILGLNPLHPSHNPLSFQNSFLWFHYLSLSLPSLMVPELEKPKITEIKVRMDCNGCVQKIKKALYGINGIYDLYIDFPQQKLTIIGWADPERIVKAIKKTRKIATICSHTEHTQPDAAAQPTEQAPDQGSPPAAEAANLPSTEPPQEPTPPEEPPKDTPPPENSQPETTTPSPVANEPDAAQPSEQPNGSNHPAHPSGSKDVGEVHVIHHHPPEYGYRYGYGHSYGGHWSKYHNSQGLAHEPPPVYVTHSYNTYKPSTYVTEYVRTVPNQKPSPYASEYEYVRTPQQTTHYSTRMERYSDEYHTGSSSNNGNITSIFSDENPNACSVM